jgi:hypothetical protein
VRFLLLLLRDRDATCCRSVDDVVCSERAEVSLTPLQAPNANADAERWVRTVRAEWLGWLLLVGRGHLDRVLRVDVAQYNQHRPHRRSRWSRRIPPPVSGSLPRIGGTGCTDATCSAVSCASTDELHEHICVPCGGG